MSYSPKRKQRAAKLYKQGLSLREIASILKMGTHRVGPMLRSMGIRIRSTNDWHKCDLDETYFETIDTEEKAYWVGFILADGYVGETNGYWYFQINLQSADWEHLAKLREALGSTHKVIKHPKARLSIRNRKLCSDLNKLGIIPNKSFHAKPANVPSDFYYHYLRGLFDGDGCIFRTTSKFGYGISVCGTRAVVNDFRRRFKIAAKTVHPIRTLWVVQTAKQSDVVRSLEAMYDGAEIYLDRKYLLYQQAIEAYYAIPNQRVVNDITGTRPTFRWIDEPKQLRLPLWS